MRRFFQTTLGLRSFAFLTLLLAGFSSPVLAGTTIHVPADQPTIQAGINAAVNGDTVLVSPGTYYENINFNGKAITVTSASGPAATMIDGSISYSPVVTFSSSETTKSVLSGFTLQNGDYEQISVFFASPTIRGNVMLGTTQFSGNGIYVQSGGGVIQGNLISGQYNGISVSSGTGVQILGNVVADNFAAGINIQYSSGADVVQQNTVVDNLAEGIFYYYPSSSVLFVQNFISGNQNAGLQWSGVGTSFGLVSNTIAANGAGCCGGSASEVLAYPINSSVTMQNNLVVADGAWAAFDCTYDSSAAAFTNNDVFSSGGSAYTTECPDQTGTGGNLSVDPLFTDLLSSNLHLQSVSPVLKAGTTSASGEPKTDFDGDARIINKSIDIGADEYTRLPNQSLSSYSLHFAAQDVSTISPPQIVTLTNNSKTVIALSLIATGPNFAETNNCGASLAAGASCQISVTFSPLAGGSLRSVLSVFTNATLNPEAVTLLGTGLAPQIQIGCCFYFYNQVIGTTNTQTESITNTGQAPLTITSIVYSGPTDFVESNNCPVSPNTLAVGASCTLTVTYTPTIVGSESGTITITSNAGAPQTLYLNGSSVSAGNPVFSPTSLTFPTTLIGQSSSLQTATLTNTGTGPLGILSITSYGDFPQTNNCPTSLAVNASCTISVTFTPSVQGSETAYINANTDSLVFYAYLTVTGTGQAPAPTISSLSLSAVPAGSTDTQVTVTGTGFVPYSSQVLWNGVTLNSCCNYYNGTTQLTFTIPAGDLGTTGTDQISILTPAPGGGTSNSLPFTVYTPVNYAIESTTYNYRNITGTNLNFYSYYQGVSLTSPFPIQFGGGSFTNLTIGAGGTISFNGFYNPYNDVIPTAQTPMLIAPFWMLLYPFGTTNGNNNNVFWQVTGTTPNRQLVVEWRNVGLCCETTNTVKFQVVFFEGNGNVQFNYADTVFGGGYSNNDNGATASVGIQAAPNLGKQFSYYQAALASKTSQLWYPSSPTATLSTSSIAFGYHQIGSSTLPQALTLTNGGIAPLNISSIATNNPDFTETNGCGTSLASHQSCSIRVYFKPSQPTTETASLTITDNATNSPQTVSLTGTGTVTSIVVYPILVNFGGVTVGTVGTAPVTLANASNAPLTIQQITTSPSVYTATNNCGTSLAPGLSCTVTVNFKPTQKGSLQGTLSMALNGKTAKVEATLTGSGQ